MHRAGFVNIIGLPNVGKSTLMNALLGEKLSIITSKAQTTRQRIFGIYNNDDLQIVFSDSPGLVRDPAYKLHESMNRYVHESFEDADVLLYITDIFALPESQPELVEKVAKVDHLPVFLVLNKIDLKDKIDFDKVLEAWTTKLPNAKVFPISALEETDLEPLLEAIKSSIPEHPPFYPKDQFSDKPERYFVAEIIREKIFMNYQKEIPYSVEIGIEVFQEDDDINRIRAIIYANKKSHKSILIGRKGEMLKKVGIESRKDIEAFLGKKAYLELFVKVRENWRDKESNLRQFGYQ